MLPEKLLLRAQDPDEQHGGESEVSNTVVWIGQNLTHPSPVEIKHGVQAIHSFLS